MTELDRLGLFGAFVPVGDFNLTLNIVRLVYGYILLAS
ncbi:hypothetical protein YpsIP31758_3263 [Yersinia pseudotuberculosis IP 31758]|uniref:Uncharacterized protein n=2 Tax=Yersinia pseudotuberculosis TaxID=633 RepID=A0A0U1QY75_YERP3|nr:hypothetical protein YpsIP31758_3263 [Yersinia pseudotuberculosis IP 31758]